ncbi:MAG: sigma-70 family RNA polymerase sigma factor [Paramuribaculum sp.]|nr:sigma-70 family RNA polymerase sigma factor [Paramuribaculum sp.]
MTTAIFNQQLMNLQSNLLNFAMTLTNNRDDAYDLLQDTTVKALTNADKYADDANFKGWVFTIMRNLFINNYRRTTRNRAVVDTTEDYYHLNLSQESGLETPEGSVAVTEITEAINTLEEKFRVPFSLHVAGYKYEEIAEQTNMPIGTIKSRIFMVRRMLRERFADYAC